MPPDSLSSSSGTIWWCRNCGIVWAADEAPLCRHGVIDPPSAPERMELLPAWHPFAKETV